MFILLMYDCVTKFINSIQFSSFESDIFRVKKVVFSDLSRIVSGLLHTFISAVDSDELQQISPFWLTLVNP